MTAAPSDPPAATAAHSITISRMFDAPLDVAWRAWTDAAHVARWWGPRGFSTRVEEHDFRTGGRWRYVMVGPDGREYPCQGLFREVTPAERFACTVEICESPGHRSLPDRPGGFVHTCRFETAGGKTRVTLTISHATAEDRRKHEDLGVVAGWNSSLDRLEELLASRSAEASSDREIVLTRVFEAPPELVWKVWTDPAHLANWWGPRGFSTTTQLMELKAGGRWSYVMHGPDGRDYQNRINYLEVDPPRRLAYTHSGDADCEPVNFSVTVTFEPTGQSGDRTRVTMHSTFASRAARDHVVREYNAIEGGKQTLARLAEHLACVRADAAGPPVPTFVISRVLRAPRDVVWQAWTQREHLARWFGPKGVSMPSCALDLRPGGMFHYCMRSPDGAEHWGRWSFREIAPPERLLFVVSFADPAGNIVRAPFDSQWPLETLSEVLLSPHAGIGKGTLVTITWSPLNTSEPERKAFDAGRAGMENGWGGTLDQLQAFLAQRQPTTPAQPS